MDLNWKTKKRCAKSTFWFSCYPSGGTSEGQFLMERDVSKDTATGACVRWPNTCTCFVVRKVTCNFAHTHSAEQAICVLFTKMNIKMAFSIFGLKCCFAKGTFLRSYFLHSNVTFLPRLHSIMKPKFSSAHLRWRNSFSSWFVNLYTSQRFSTFS